MLNIVVTGWKGCGKGTVSKMLAEKLQCETMSSSWLACDLFIFDKLKDKYGYATKEECFADRINRRAEWYELIKEYNGYDGAALAKKLFEVANIYDGVRDLDELYAMKLDGIVDYVIWVDGYERTGQQEDESSMNVTMEHCDFIIDNNGSEEELCGYIQTVVDILENKMTRLRNEIPKTSLEDIIHSAVTKMQVGFDNDWIKIIKSLIVNFSVGFMDDEPCLRRIFNGNTAISVYGDKDGRYGAIGFKTIPIQEPGSEIKEEDKLNADKFLEFYFTDPKSLDVLIKSATVCRDKMIELRQTAED